VEAERHQLEREEGGWRLRGTGRRGGVAPGSGAAPAGVGGGLVVAVGHLVVCVAGVWRRSGARWRGRGASGG
jgi:hypothetical protein